MGDFFWSSQNPNGQDVRCEGGEVVHVDPKSIGSIAADAGNFVWQPGGVQGGNVYNNWPDLAKAIALVRGQKTVTVNTTTAAAHVTTGAWPGITDVTFLGGETSPVTPVVTVDDGATFTSTRKLTLDSVVFSYAGTVAPCIADTATSIEVNCTNEAIVQQTGGQPFVSISTNAVLMISNVEKGAGWGAGTLAVGAGTVLEVLGTSGGFLAAAAATGLGTILVASDGASLPGTGGGMNAQTGVTTNSVEVTDPQPTFVFKPGATGTLNGNVFTTWATLMVAVALVPGTKTIYIDDTLASANTSAGTFSLEGVFFTSVRGAAAPVLHIVEGTVFTGTTRFIVEDGITLQCEATVTVPFVSSAGVNPVFRGQLRGAAILQSTGAIPFFQKSAGGSINLICENGVNLGDGTHAVATVDAGQTINFQLYSSSTLKAHGCAGAGTCSVVLDPSGTVNAQDATTVSVSVQGQNVIGQTTALGAGTASPATFTPSSSSITRKRDGKVHAKAGFSGTASAAGVVTMILLRDATPIAESVTQVKTNGDAFSVDVDVIDTLPDATAHAYTYTLTNGAGGTFTGTTLGTYLWVNENV